jgi:hypothetical protein
VSLKPEFYPALTIARYNHKSHAFLVAQVDPMIINDYETAREQLALMTSDFAREGSQLNEATTRLRYIDRLFFDCLGWEKTDCVAEQFHSGEYADYEFLAPRLQLIVEAKREGNYFQLPAGIKSLAYSIKTLIKDFPELGEAIKQVAKYCQDRGAVLAAVANGHQIVVFMAIRIGEAWSDGQALVFPSIEFMNDNFLELWNSLSKAGVEERRLERRLYGSFATPLPPKLRVSIQDYPGTKSRNPFQADLRALSELVIEDWSLAPENETKFLTECYSSSGALSEYALQSRAILQARYEALFSENNVDLTVVPVSNKEGNSNQLLVESVTRRPILLIGDVGVGKTTFIRHLIKVDAVQQLSNAYAIHLNLGQQAALTSDIRTFIIDQVIHDLDSRYQIDLSSDNLIRKIYSVEIKRFAESGIYARLRESNPGLFTQKEIEFLEMKIADKVKHLQNAISHFQKSWRKQVVVFLDNADQRDYAMT